MNLSVYGSPTIEKIPIVVRSTLLSVSQTFKVDPIKSSGSPEENPRQRIVSRRGLRKALISASMIKVSNGPRPLLVQIRDLDFGGREARLPAGAVDISCARQSHTHASMFARRGLTENPNLAVFYA